MQRVRANHEIRNEHVPTTPTASIGGLSPCCLTGDDYIIRDKQNPAGLQQIVDLLSRLAPLFCLVEQLNPGPDLGIAEQGQ